MIKKICNIFLIVLLLPLFMLNVRAAPIDPSANGSILGLYKSGSKLLTNLNVSIYKIANVDSEGKLTYVDNFAQAGYELNGLTSSQMNQLMNNLDKYVGNKNIKPTKSSKTDNDGRVRFDNLSTGLYLIKSDEYISNNYAYKGENLITIPNLNQNTNTYMYDIEMVPKIDVKQISEPDNGENNNNNSNNNKSNIPNTYDSIYMYFGIFFITILGIVMIVYYISKTKRSEEK